MCLVLFSVVFTIKRWALVLTITIAVVGLVLGCVSIILYITKLEDIDNDEKQENTEKGISKPHGK